MAQNKQAGPTRERLMRQEAARMILDMKRDNAAGIISTVGGLEGYCDKHATPENVAQLIAAGRVPAVMFLEQNDAENAMCLTDGVTLAETDDDVHYSSMDMKRAADMIHSDNELGQKMEPAVSGPEAGPSNDELVENSHIENGASPVIDGDLHSPERANVNAIREAIETQAEMEVGKPIDKKQEQVGKAVEKAEARADGKTVEINGEPGKQIIINIAAQQVTEPIGGEDQGKITSGHGGGAFGGTDLEGPDMHVASWDYPTKKAAILKNAKLLNEDELRKAGKEYLKRIRTAAVEVAQGEDAQGFHMIIRMSGREYVLRGQDADTFRREYSAIPKPEAKVNALVEKYMWKLQPYGQKPQQPKPQAQPQPQSQRPSQPFQPQVMRSQPSAPVSQRQGSKTAHGVMRCPWCGGEAVKQRPEDSYKCTKCGWQQGKSASKIAAEGQEFEGYSNWATWHVALLMDNTESAYNSKRRLTQNALEKNIGVDQLAGQFQRFFHRQEEETQQLHEDNASSARTDRGEYERQQLEGTEPNSGNKAKDMADKLFGMFYEMGGESGWEQPIGEVNWREIAQEALDEEAEEHPELKPEAKEPEFTEQDHREVLKPMGVKSSKRGKDVKKATTETNVVAGEGMAKSEVELEKEAGFNFFFPGQVLKEFYPEIQHEIVDYPNATNTPVGVEAPEMVGDGGHEIDSLVDGALDNISIVEMIQLPADVSEPEPLQMAAADGNDPDVSTNDPGVSTSPAGGLGIGLDGKPSGGLETAGGVRGIRGEGGIRGPMFTDEFYGQYSGVPGASLQVASKQAADQQKMFAVLDRWWQRFDQGVTKPVGHGPAPEDITLEGGAKDLAQKRFAKDTDEGYRIAEMWRKTRWPKENFEVQAASKSAKATNDDDLRGMGDVWREEFYAQYGNGPSAQSILSKKAAGTEIEQFGMFLKKVCGEIAATMISAFKTTSRPLLDKVPGVGEVQLAQVEQPQGLSGFATVNTGSRVKYLMDKLNDGDIQNAINDSWAQAAVWHDGPKGGFVYEVFVRMESIDTDSMIAKYRFVAGTRE